MKQRSLAVMSVLNVYIFVTSCIFNDAAHSVTISLDDLATCGRSAGG